MAVKWVWCLAPEWGNRHKLEQRKFCKNVGENFFTSRVTEHWNKLPSEVMVSPLEILKMSGHVSGHGSRDPALAGQLD